MSRFGRTKWSNVVGLGPEFYLPEWLFRLEEVYARRGCLGREASVLPPLPQLFGSVNKRVDEL